MRRTPRLAGALLACLLVLSGCAQPLAATPAEGEPSAPATDAASPSGDQTTPNPDATDATAGTGDGSGGAGTPAERPDTATPQGQKNDRRQNGEQNPDRPDDLSTLDVPELSDAVDRGPILGADASWPQCPKGAGIPQKRTLGAPMPIEEAEYVVLGLTNGPAFYPNPCLADQAHWVRERGKMAAAYSVLSFPEDRHLKKLGDRGPYDGSTRLGALRNVGYQQALFNIDTMESSGLRSPIVWLDVEPVPDFEWSDDPRANAAVVEGAARGYQDNGLRIGVYSTHYMWTQVVGDFQLGVPEWRPAGQTSREAALRQCRPDKEIQGGEPVLAQWVERGRDMNVTCPGPIHLDLWFHQY